MTSAATNPIAAAIATIAVALCVGLIVAPAAATAEPVACTGSCLVTLAIFDPAAAHVCDRAELTVTYTTGGTIIGGDIYRYDSAIARAATHMGLVKTGETKTIYAYWAGLRSAFAAVRRNSITSTAQNGDGYGVLLSESATCPQTEFSATMTPVSNIEYYVTTTTYYGVGWWRWDTLVNHAARQFGYVSSAQPVSTQTLYLHATVANHPFFLRGTLEGATTSYTRGAAEAFRLDTSRSVTYDPASTYVDGCCHPRQIVRAVRRRWRRDMRCGHADHVAVRGGDTRQSDGFEMDQRWAHGRERNNHRGPRERTCDRDDAVQQREGGVDRWGASVEGNRGRSADSCCDICDVDDGRAVNGAEGIEVKHARGAAARRVDDEEGATEGDAGIHPRASAGGSDNPRRPIRTDAFVLATGDGHARAGPRNIRIRVHRHRAQNSLAVRDCVKHLHSAVCDRDVDLPVQR